MKKKENRAKTEVLSNKLLEEMQKIITDPAHESHLDIKQVQTYIKCYKDLSPQVNTDTKVLVIHDLVTYLRKNKLYSVDIGKILESYVESL